MYLAHVGLHVAHVVLRMLQMLLHVERVLGSVHSRVHSRLVVTVGGIAIYIVHGWLHALWGQGVVHQDWFVGILAHVAHARECCGLDVTPRVAAAYVVCIRKC